MVGRGPTLHLTMTYRGAFFFVIASREAAWRSLLLCARTTRWPRPFGPRHDERRYRSLERVRKGSERWTSPFLIPSPLVGEGLGGGAAHKG